MGAQQAVNQVVWVGLLPTGTATLLKNSPRVVILFGFFTSVMPQQAGLTLSHSLNRTSRA